MPSFQEFFIKYFKFFFLLHNLYIKNKIYKKKKFYSHSGEDLFILNKFKKKGFYVDVGCHHPTKLNNCHLLYLNGWRGVNIDINEITIDLFNFVRKEDINVNKAISLKEGIVKYFYSKPLSLYNSLIDRENFEYSKDIESSSLNKILSETKYKNKQIDFLSIDVEGKDFEVLQSLNFEKYKPIYICVEIWGDTKERNFKLENSKIYKLLTEKDYKLVFNKMENYIFFKNYSIN